MSNTNDWAYIWVCHLIKHSHLIEQLPFGWCVYSEAVDLD
jgi:hypothetical protein